MSSVVGIFWDYENCQYTSGCSGFDIAQSVERVALAYGPIRSYNAYLDIQQCAIPTSLRSELQSTGVTLVDCPHNGQKDVVDHMLQTDMMAFALDHPAPATIVLISGDRDFAYVASVLRRRKYKVILICHSVPGPHKSLLRQVARHVDWNTEILGLRRPDPIHRTTAEVVPSSRYMLPSMPSARTMSTTSHSPLLDTLKSQGSALRADGLSITAEAQPPLLSSSYRLVPAVPVDSPSISSLPMNDGEENSSQRPSDVSTSSPETSGISDDDARQIPLSSPDSSASLDPTASPLPFTPPATDTAAVPTFTEVLIQEDTLSPPIPSAPAVFAPLIQALRSLADKGETKPLRSTVGIALNAKNTDVYEKAGVSTFKAYAAAATAAGIITLGGTEAKAWITLAQNAAVSSSPASSATASSVVAALGDEREAPPTSIIEDKLDVSSHQEPASVDSPSTSTCSAPSDSSLDTALSLSTSQEVPPEITPDQACSVDIFQPLISVLRLLYEQGDVRPRRAVVSVHVMAQDMHAYTKGGFSRFGDYAAAAAAAGVAHLGGAEGGASPWIALSEAYLGRCNADKTLSSPGSVRLGDAAGFPQMVGDAQLNTQPIPAPVIASHPGLPDTTSSFSFIQNASTSSAPSSFPQAFPPNAALARTVATMHFKPLVDILLVLLEAGNPRPRRQEVSTRITRTYSHIYKQTSISDFDGLCTAASTGGVVELGGADSNAWMALTPAYASLLRPSPAPDCGIPVHFRPLVQLLQAQVRAGYQRSNRSVIGGILRTRDPALYRKAEVKDYAGYIQQASEMGLVTLGLGLKEGESPWIALAEGWREGTA
ncbi:NYN domain-containing protein [Schizophyllum amplum]|uniref:NYN domain-containing protein n=1 Tax=Schizophyllum amplum TaxID=97359 RepID=A0A550CAA0_9AGAR|nr:NYN domain-containing protein [Auriculariopsis ampla]